MPDTIDSFFRNRPPTAAEPLRGRTMLLVEDSRFACEAIRLIALRSGARIRRADGIRSAERHLRTYSPSIAIVDIGLPDGDGLSLIARLAAAQPRIPAIIATSGDDTLAGPSRAAGADAFLAKPVVAVAAFQELVLGCLPKDLRPTGPRSMSAEVVAPDAMALRDDLAHAADLLRTSAAPARMPYLAAFLSGLAKSSDDAALADAADALCRGEGRETALRLVEDRLSAAMTV